MHLIEEIYFPSSAGVAGGLFFPFKISSEAMQAIDKQTGNPWRITCFQEQCIEINFQTSQSPAVT